MTILYFLFEVLEALLLSGVCVGVLLFGIFALAYIFFEDPDLTPRGGVIESMIIVLTIIVLLWD